MVPAAELQLLSPGLRVWSAYDPEVKAELWSTAIQLDDRLYLVDPIPLRSAARAELTAPASICGVFITNANHARAVADFAARSGAAVMAAPATASTLWDLEVVLVEAGDRAGEQIEVIEIAGAGEGEIALHFQGDGGALVLGDALINFGSDGFAFLPAKYCQDQKLMRRSLRQLLDFSFERLLFAHGVPIVSSARRKLETLLAE